MRANEAAFARPIGKALNHFSPSNVGLTVREYFVTHAPPIPQPWFVPVMDEEEPGLTDPVDILPVEMHDDWRKIDGMGLPPINVEALKREGKPPEFIACAERVLQEREAFRLYDLRYRRELYAQWPLAWADLMLERLEK